MNNWKAYLQLRALIEEKSASEARIIAFLKEKKQLLEDKNIVSLVLDITINNGKNKVLSFLHKSGVDLFDVKTSRIVGSFYTDYPIDTLDVHLVNQIPFDTFVYLHKAGLKYTTTPALFYAFEKIVENTLLARLTSFNKEIVQTAKIAVDTYKNYFCYIASNEQIDLKNLTHTANGKLPDFANELDQELFEQISHKEPFAPKILSQLVYECEKNSQPER